ncbi:MAG TPA: hypothetical protein VK428_08290 [Acidimicrobiales bacterium]|nr:hypothetical protein [Acidimicrobiales bacterium]
MAAAGWVLAGSVLAGSVLAGSVLAGCSSSSPAAPAYELQAAAVSGVGTVVVDGQGYTLYLFEPDHQSDPTCSGPCAAAWPPLLLPDGISAPRAGKGVEASLLGIVRRSDGSFQITYDHWPLYRWVGDNRPGIATGEGLDNFGGLWYAISPHGRTVTS